MTKSLPGTIQNTKAPQATMDPDLRRGDAVLVPSNHNPYLSPMTNITHKPGIQTIPPRHTGAGRYPLQATQPPQKRAVQKIPPLAGAKSTLPSNAKKSINWGAGPICIVGKWEYAMQYQNPAAQLMDRTMRFSLSHDILCRCILHSGRCLHQPPNCHSKSYRSTEH